MKFKSFKDWFNSQESSAFTRARTAAFLGLGPKIASPFSRSTPPPAMVDKLVNDVEEDQPKKKKKKKKDKDKKDEAHHERMPDYSFDSFVRKLQQAKIDTDKDLADAEKTEKDLDKKLKAKKDQDKKDQTNDKKLRPFGNKDQSDSKDADEPNDKKPLDNRNRKK